MMKIICLIENEIAREAAETGLICEHGLCLYIEYQGKRYLLDSGSTDAFAENADKLGVNLAAVDEAILSHAHYDHSGGYEIFFARNNDAKLLVQQSLMHKMCYKKIAEQGSKVNQTGEANETSEANQTGEANETSEANQTGEVNQNSEINQVFKTKQELESNQDFSMKYIGIPENLRRKYKNRLVPIEGTCQLASGVWLVTGSDTGAEAQRIKKRSVITKMYCACDNGYEVDDFSHEQSLVFEQEVSGLVVCSSCSHQGIDLMVEHIMRQLNKPVHTVVGGFHLKGATGLDSLNMSEAEVRKIAMRLQELGVRDVYTGHCTGSAGYEVLEEILGERLHHLSTGTIIEL